MERLASFVSASFFWAVAFGAGWVFGWKWSADFEASYPDFATNLYVFFVLLASHTMEYLVRELIEYLRRPWGRDDGYSTVPDETGQHPPVQSEAADEG